MKATLSPLAMGVRLRIEFAERVGARLGVTDAIWVDERMRTSVNDVYAVGDCVETRDLVTGEPVRMPSAPTVNKMGYVAGTNVAGGDAKFPGVVRTSVTAYMDTIVAATGLRRGRPEKRI